MRGVVAQRGAVVALAFAVLSFGSCVTTQGKGILFYEQERSVQSMRRLDIIEDGCQLIKTREAEEGPVARAIFRNYAAEARTWSPRTRPGTISTRRGSTAVPTSRSASWSFYLSVLSVRMRCHANSSESSSPRSATMERAARTG
jgi:hypothetical protein